MMKKLVSILLMFALIFSFAACSEKPSDSDAAVSERVKVKKDDDSEEENSTIKNQVKEAADNSDESSDEDSADADIVIKKSDISATAMFIPVEVDGTPLEVIAVSAPDGTIRTAFNTCQVCYDSGRGFYKQQGNELVCQNCGNHFTMDRVEVDSGGCNPVPIWDEWTTETEDSITIPLALLQEAKVIFGNWKAE